ncbi:serine/threonine protein kinase, CMGC, CDC2/CDK sub [Ophidiomyces ophidiicola]|nr:serine/threonine protein kinase, CMGC, CDC2/CDK sub [Ophidiomyces ophidiicola]KAI1995807.1 serine/threonine protein kinase, CMGC, CDC2/CDK sub [Ophidiomyces ophidiicola]KAI2000847.1 serine/threonine protein kinase, CMGC, CDC2/CDK sub [Ophidiomyces ophidiicola]
MEQRSVASFFPLPVTISGVSLGEAANRDLRQWSAFTPLYRYQSASRSVTPKRLASTDAVDDCMAASSGSPLMRDQWRVDDDRHAAHHTRPRTGETDSRRPRSPLPSRYYHRGREGSSRKHVTNSPPFHHSHRLQSGSRDLRNTRAIPWHDHAENRDAKHSIENQVRSRRREPILLSPSHPPFPKRRRSSSPPLSTSYRRARHHDGRDYDRGGRFGRGASRSQRHHSPGPFVPSRESGPRRESNFSQAPTSDSLSISRHRRSRSPAPSAYGRRPSLSPRSTTARFSDSDTYSLRPTSRPSSVSGRSRESPPLRARRSMQSTRSTQPIADGPLDPPVSFRPTPSHDIPSSNTSVDSDTPLRLAYSPHNMRPSDSRGSRRQAHPHVDTRPQYAGSPQYVAGTDSRHSSPQSGSPYGGSRGSWGSQQPPYSHGQQRQLHGYSPPYRQSNYPPQGGSQGQYYQSPQVQYPPSTNPGQQAYSGQPSYRGGPSSYRGNPYNQPPPDRRFSNPTSQGYGSPPQPQRSRSGHFTSLQWTASGGRGRGSQSAAGPHLPTQSLPPLQSPHHADNERMSPDIDEDDNPFRPSKDLQVEDEEAVKISEATDTKKMPPPRQSNPTSQPKEPGKFSFAFKSKVPSTTVPKPVSGLAQKMREPPRPVEPPKKEHQSVIPRPKYESRLDRRDDRRDRDGRKMDRRFDRRDDKRRERREDWRPDTRHDRRKERDHERSPNPDKAKKKMLIRMKPRPTLTEEFSQSESVYYRKPGNESVVGAGTYGKVFKAVHVFTKNMVALKRIRMEGEKDGFPITAVREIRLLQHLRHENVVRLQEVMVERNECFMVFEYLSHDMTGLINHPSFTLTSAHKKHLAKQMFDGLNYLHHRGVLHRDIKAANILISNKGQLKFADFGLARFFSKNRQLDYTNRVITIWYRPPELLLGETRYGPAVDVWSAACVYMEMFTKKAIFPGDGTEINQLDKLYNSLGTPTRGDWPGIIDMPWFELMRPREKKIRVFEETYKDHLSPAALDLVCKIFQYDPAKRPSTEEVLAHPYFTDEEPSPQQAIELAEVKGDWHEFESKAHRKEKDKEARRAEQREKEKRRISSMAGDSADRERKRPKVDDDTSAPVSQSCEN